MDTSLSSNEYDFLRKKITAICISRVPRHVVDEVVDETIVQVTKRVHTNGITWGYLCSKYGTKVCEYAICDAIKVLMKRRTVRATVPDISLEDEACPEISYMQEFDENILADQWWDGLSPIQRDVVALRNSPQDFTWCAIGKQLDRSHTWIKMSWNSAMTKALDIGLVA